MDSINYNNRRFVSISNTPNGEVDSATYFDYYQEDDVVWATYSGGNIVRGHLIATVKADSSLDMRYHHVNSAGDLMTGQCHSTPEILPDGRIRLYEVWQWTAGDHSSGTSIVEEIGATRQ